MARGDQSKIYAESNDSDFLKMRRIRRSGFLNRVA